MIAQEDRELAPWIWGILNGKPTSAGGFLTSLAETATRADFENYPLLRLALIEIAKRYPEYHDPEAIP